LKIHKDDRSIGGDYGVGAWPIKTQLAFRYFRLIQTGPNARSDLERKDDEWINVFVVGGLELYGTVIITSTS
jgi:hypothetical protein